MASNQIKLTASDFYKTEDLIPEAVLDENDPLHDIQRLAGLTPGLNAGSLQE